MLHYKAATTSLAYHFMQTIDNNYFIQIDIGMVSLSLIMINDKRPFCVFKPLFIIGSLESP